MQESRILPADEIAKCSQRERQAIFRAACLVGMIDGELDSTEKAMLRTLQDELELDKSFVNQVSNEFRNRERRIERPESMAAKELMLVAMKKVCAADNVERPAEQRLFKQLESALGISLPESSDEKAEPVFIPDNTPRYPLTEEQIADSKTNDDNPGDKGFLRSPLLSALLSGLQSEKRRFEIPKEIGEDEVEPLSLRERNRERVVTFFKSFAIVGISYVVTAIAIGWDLNDLFGMGKSGLGYWGGFLIAVVALIFTFTHGFLVGSLGLVIFGSKLQEKSKSIVADSSNPGAAKLPTLFVVGFFMVWFGGWYFGPVVALGVMTSGMSLAWFFVHLALTPPGSRMLAYIEHGSTSLALLFACGVAATGNWLALFLLLTAQAVMLTAMDLVSKAANKKRGKDSVDMLEQVGLRLDQGWRTGFDLLLRLVFFALAIGFVLLHFFFNRSSLFG